MIRLLCVEDNPLVRAYLEQRLALEIDIRVMSSCAHARGALNYLTHSDHHAEALPKGACRR